MHTFQGLFLLDGPHNHAKRQITIIVPVIEAVLGNDGFIGVTERRQIAPVIEQLHRLRVVVGLLIRRSDKFAVAKKPEEQMNLAVVFVTHHVKENKLIGHVMPPADSAPTLRQSHAPIVMFLICPVNAICGNLYDLKWLIFFLEPLLTQFLEPIEGKSCQGT